MSKKITINPLTVAIGTALVGGLTAAGSVSARVATDANPFAMEELSNGYQMAGAEGSCGENKGEEGSCGESKGGEGSCGESKGGEGSCGESKGGEGKCGEGKCGEGKCGGSA
ncbi:MAG: hypothetical protein ACE5G3_10280 [Gammaproteobacteria bacterium]